MIQYPNAQKSANRASAPAKEGVTQEQASKESSKEEGKPNAERADCTSPTHRKEECIRINLRKSRPEGTLFLVPRCARQPSQRRNLGVLFLLRPSRKSSPKYFMAKPQPPPPPQNPQRPSNPNIPIWEGQVVPPAPRPQRPSPKK